MKTKALFKELSAGEISKLAGEELMRRNCFTWRQNNTTAIRGRTFIGLRGVSDRIGYNMSTGVMVACEVKKIGDTMKPDQIDFLTRLKNAGGFTFVALQDKYTGLFLLTQFNP